MVVCSICCDEVTPTVFHCPKPSCPISMCADCIKLAFDDATGDNARACPSCKTSIGLGLVEAVCGKGALRVVEREVRVDVEMQLRLEAAKRSAGPEVMKGYREKAQSLFHEVCDKMNMRCPRCGLVFVDYDGCNALTCGRSSCGAHFCAICLEDCGSDAHPHVITQHGNYFDKKQFEESKIQRETKIVQEFLSGIKDEPFEVQEMVRILLKGSHTPSSVNAGGVAKLRSFVTRSKLDLSNAVKNDRLSVLQDTGSEARPLRGEDISPRCEVPEDYRLRLQEIKSNNYRIVLEKRHGLIWTRVPVLPGDEENSPAELVVDSLQNIRSSLSCGVIAFQGHRHLYQSKRVSLSSASGGAPASDEVSIVLSPVARVGSVEEGREMTLEGIGALDVPIIGINQNRRLVALERYVHGMESNDLVFDALRDFVGHTGPCKRMLTTIKNPAPETFLALNEEQRSVAHPLTLSSAKEVAGPPGTGKTKTITEFVRGILSCSPYDIVILSERNGAIDAIAQKFALECLASWDKGRLSLEDLMEADVRRRPFHVRDFEVWMNLRTYGSSKAIGLCTKLFTLGEKMRYVSCPWISLC